MGRLVIFITILSVLGCQDSENISLIEYAYDWNDGENIISYSTIRLEKKTTFNNLQSFTYFYDSSYRYPSNEFINDHDGFYVIYKKVPDNDMYDNMCALQATYHDERPSECFSFVDSLMYLVDSASYKVYKFKRENPPDDGNADLYWTDEFGLIQSYGSDWGIKVIYSEYSRKGWNKIVDILNQKILDDTSFYEK